MDIVGGYPGALELIASATDPARDLTTHTCSGVVSVANVYATVAQFYQGKPTRNVLWDFTAADLSQIRSAEIRTLAERVKQAAHSRAGGRTAIVAPADEAFGLSRMYQVFAELAEQIAGVGVFRSLAEAVRWIE